MLGWHIPFAGTTTREVVVPDPEPAFGSDDRSAVRPFPGWHPGVDSGIEAGITTSGSPRRCSAFAADRSASTLIAAADTWEYGGLPTPPDLDKDGVGDACDAFPNTVFGTAGVVRLNDM